MFDPNCSCGVYDELEKVKKLNIELETIINSCSDGICVFDKNGVGLRANAAIKSLTGLEEEDIIGTDVRTLKEKNIINDSVVLQVLLQKKRITMMQYFYNGRECIVTGTPVFNEKGEIEKIVTNVRDVTQLNKLKEELERTKQLYSQFQFNQNKQKLMVAESKEMKDVIELAYRFSQVDTTVFIHGESGVGKELVAQMIHEYSHRKNTGTFIKLNCAAIPEQLLESELFGYEKGAFTGARREGKPGVFELADKGTLFLDEIGDLYLPMQAKLLRVLQDREFVRVGGTKPIKVDVRIISATNKNLEQMVNKGEFRKDLYYRLNVLPVTIPPLRQRPVDIPALLHHYLEKFNKKYSLNKSFSPSAMMHLMKYSWPGNVRELGNLVERLVLITPADRITSEDLPEKICTEDRHIAENPGDLKKRLEILERKIIKLALQKYENTYKAAKALGISQPTFVRKVQKYNLRKE
ncbi:sigma 54-interacting transcriptional regulator [Desulfallas sp. Bu1-1]|uniref:sigma-54 interaction domain-containing protein n=1 Tax=Desulfallas sp. Bu1-1 TaxID=2787620 RepID=UPI00189EC6ED|nr:sigma 54-interacting transcriptional regulator [Desulfallas sp. Bu1-1]MBF7084510.1 sigma 54-interacting transcriptional regulator [Desulfallas sp. Bu1-1]